MKIILVALAAMTSLSAFSGTLVSKKSLESTFAPPAGNLYYSDGPAKGEEVSEVPAYIGYQNICFVGNGFAAKSSLYSLLDNDHERSSVFTFFHKNKDILNYGYTDNKCIDDGEDAENCRSVKTAKRCH